MSNNEDNGNLAAFMAIGSPDDGKTEMDMAVAKIRKSAPIVQRGNISHLVSSAKYKKPKMLNLPIAFEVAFQILSERTTLADGNYTEYLRTAVAEKLMKDMNSIRKLKKGEHAFQFIEEEIVNAINEEEAKKNLKKLKSK